MTGIRSALIAKPHNPIIVQLAFADIRASGQARSPLSRRARDNPDDETL